jgi:quinol monooxygenase YgiN
MFRKSLVTLALLLLAAFSLTSVSAQEEFDPNQPLPLYLLTIRGTLAPETLADAQTLHNATAGAPESVTAAQSLGDLSHMVYHPMQPAESGAGEILFIDQWNSIEGLNSFFANPAVQEQAGQLFTERAADVWVPAEGFYTYHLPAPYADSDRIIVMVRGTVASREAAMTVHNQIVASQINIARQAGDISHEVYFMMTPPDQPESLEFLAIDVWTNAEGMQAYYGDPGFQAGVMQLFTAAPTISIWNQTTGQWVEW